LRKGERFRSFLEEEDREEWKKKGTVKSSASPLLIREKDPKTAGLGERGSRVVQRKKDEKKGGRRENEATGL